MKMNDIIREYVEERLFLMEDETGMGFQLCCQSYSGTLHAYLNQSIDGCMDLDDRKIESVVGQYFKVDSCDCGEIYFNLFPEAWDKLQRKLKIQMILEE